MNQRQIFEGNLRELQVSCIPDDRIAIELGRVHTRTYPSQLNTELYEELKSVMYKRVRITIEEIP